MTSAWGRIAQSEADPTPGRGVARGELTSQNSAHPTRYGWYTWPWGSTCCPGRIIMDPVGVTYIKGGSRGYAWGTHMDRGNLYVFPRKLTGRVPDRCSSSALLPLGNAAASQPLPCSGVVITGDCIGLYCAAKGEGGVAVLWTSVRGAREEYRARA